MSGLYPTSIPQQFTGEGWYGDPNSARQIGETIIRSSALQLATLIAFGHLLSLRQISNRRTLVSVLCLGVCLLFPTLPVAQLLRNFHSTVIVLYHRGGLSHHWVFYLSCILGMHATMASGASETSALLHFDPASLRRTRLRYGAKFTGRMLVLLALLAQLSGTVLLWVRRAHVYLGPNRLWAIDNRNLEVACSAIFVVFFSIGIQCVNSNWVLPDASPRILGVGSSPERRPVVTEHNPETSLPSSLQPLDFFAMTTSTEPPENPANRRRARDRTARVGLVGKFTTYVHSLYQLLSLHFILPVGIILSKLRGFKMFGFNQWTLHTHDFQLDLELAYLLHIVFYAFFSMSGNSYEDKGYGWQYGLEFMKSRGDFQRIASLIGWHQPGPGYSEYHSQMTRLNVLMCLYFLPFFLILLKAILSLVPTGPVVQLIPRKWSVFPSKAIRWLSKCQYAFYILFNISLMYSVLLQCLVLKGSFQVLSDFEFTFQNYPRVRRPGTIETFKLWKDPWSETLFVI